MKTVRKFSFYLLSLLSIPFGILLFICFGMKDAGKNEKMKKYLRELKSGKRIINPNEELVLCNSFLSHIAFSMIRSEEQFPELFLTQSRLLQRRKELLENKQ